MSLDLTDQPEKFVLKPKPEVFKNATLSKCGKYRFELDRSWEPFGHNVNFIMLNPSTADANQDDPTLRRCIDFAMGWGFNSLTVTNLYAFRSKDPKKLKTAADPIGPDNDKWILKNAGFATLVVAAWGEGGEERGPIVTQFLADAGVKLTALRYTKSGQPMHPLYLPKSLKPSPMNLPK